METHTCNPSTQKADAGRTTANLRAAWTIWEEPVQNKNKTPQKAHKNFLIIYIYSSVTVGSGSFQLRTENILVVKKLRLD